MTRQGAAQVIGGLQIGGGVLALALAGLGFDVVTPDIHESISTVVHAPAQPTGSPKPRTPIDKTTLIIQQNSQCWIGQPGATCGPERTYR